MIWLLLILASPLFVTLALGLWCVLTISGDADDDLDALAWEAQQVEVKAKPKARNAA